MSHSELLTVRVELASGRKNKHLAAAAKHDWPFVKMLCGATARHESTKVDRTMPIVERIGPHDWDNYDAGGTCSTCFDTHVARVSKYLYHRLLEPKWQHFTGANVTEGFDGEVTYKHGIYSAKLAGYYVIKGHVVTQATANTPGAYPKFNCANQPINRMMDRSRRISFLLNEEHQYQLINFTACPTLLKEEGLTDSFYYMARQTPKLNKLDKVLLVDAFALSLEEDHEE